MRFRAPTPRARLASGVHATRLPGGHWLLGRRPFAVPPWLHRHLQHRDAALAPRSDARGSGTVAHPAGCSVASRDRGRHLRFRVHLGGTTQLQLDRVTNSPDPEHDTPGLEHDMQQPSRDQLLRCGVVQPKPCACIANWAGPLGPRRDDRQGDPESSRTSTTEILGGHFEPVTVGSPQAVSKQRGGANSRRPKCLIESARSLRPLRSV